MSNVSLVAMAYELEQSRRIAAAGLATMPEAEKVRMLLAAMRVSPLPEALAARVMPAVALYIPPPPPRRFAPYPGQGSADDDQAGAA